MRKYQDCLDLKRLPDKLFNGIRLTPHILITLQPAIFPLSEHVLSFHESSGEAMGLLCGLVYSDFTIYEFLGHYPIPNFLRLIGPIKSHANRWSVRWALISYCKIRNLISIMVPHLNRGFVFVVKNEPDVLQSCLLMCFTKLVHLVKHGHRHNCHGEIKVSGSYRWESYR